MKKEFNQFYIVKQGDTIDKIAQKYGVSALSILIENAISPKMIREGFVLFIKR